MSATREVFIGRDLDCQIVLDSKHYSNVSRHHAVIRPFLSAPDVITWEIEDLGSANGTYVNGQRVRENCSLQIGDRVSIGRHGPEFIFESQDKLNQAQLSCSDFVHHSNPQASNSLSLSQLFPIISTVWDLPKKAHLIPISITVIVVILMFAKVGDPDPTDFNRILGIYLGSVTYYFIYQLCGKQKPWWVVLVTALATMLMLNSPLWSLFDLVFRRILPGEMPKSPETAGFFALLVAHFFGAGLMEELFKVLPVLGASFLGQILPEPWRKQIGVWEPLDGILLGTASALGFTFVETLGQYVPKVVEIWGSRAGWELLIARILGSVACHIAYSGYFGYCIGLSILKPARRWQILAVGYLTVALLHALWNASGSLNLWLLVIVGVVSYAFLAAAILKARSLSSFNLKKESS